MHKLSSSFRLLKSCNTNVRFLQCWLADR